MGVSTLASRCLPWLVPCLACLALAGLWQNAEKDRERLVREAGQQELVIAEQQLALEVRHNASLRTDRVLFDWAGNTGSVVFQAAETAAKIQEATSETVDIDAYLPAALTEPLLVRWQKAGTATAGQGDARIAPGSLNAGAAHSRATQE